MLPQLLVVSVELSELVRQNISIGHEIKVRLPVFLLHADDVVAETVLPRYLVTLREMVDLLVLVQSFI